MDLEEIDFDFSMGRRGRRSPVPHRRKTNRVSTVAEYVNIIHSHTMQNVLIIPSVATYVHSTCTATHLHMQLRHCSFIF